MGRMLLIIVDFLVETIVIIYELIKLESSC